MLSGVSMTLKSGSLNGLIGPGGSGKSALLKIMVGISKADSGAVNIEHPNHDDEPTFGFMFQEGALFDSLNVFDNVAFPLARGKVPAGLLGRKKRREVTIAVREVLAKLGLSKAEKKLPGQLSGGMRRRVSLARAIVTRPAYVLLDDPTSGLDPVASSVIMNLISGLQREYRPTMLIVSQDLRRLLPMVDTIFALYDGSIQFEGTLSDLKKCSKEYLRSFVSCRYDLNAPSGA